MLEPSFCCQRLKGSPAVALPWPCDQLISEGIFIWEGIYGFREGLLDLKAETNLLKELQLCRSRGPVGKLSQYHYFYLSTPSTPSKIRRDFRAEWRPKGGL
jgi:hypothetical protein